jgi:hypothetical protein
MFGGAKILLTIAVCGRRHRSLRRPRTKDDSIRRHLCWRVAGFGDALDAPSTRYCSPNSRPEPLTIAGGVASWRGTEGSVNAQGVRVLHPGLGAPIDAQIDGRGTVTGRMTSFCSYHMVWQKEGK